MLSKIRHFTESFASHLKYFLLVWAQNAKSVKKKKSLRLAHLLNKNANTSNPFKSLNTLKFPNKATLEYCILTCKYFNQTLTTT